MIAMDEELLLGVDNSNYYSLVSLLDVFINI